MERLRRDARLRMDRLRDAFTVFQTITYVAGVITLAFWLHDKIEPTL